MGFETLLGGSCYTTSEAQKLVDRINAKSAANVSKISGRWVYFVDLEIGTDLPNVKQLVQADTLPETTSRNENANAVDIYISPRTNPSPWSSKATSIAQVCGVKANIERGRMVTIEFSQPFNGDLSFKDVIHDRMTESFTEIRPEPTAMFTQGVRGELVVVDIFADEKGPVAALQEYNSKMGLGLDQPSVDYLVEQYKSLGRSPVRFLLTQYDFNQVLIPSDVE
jgi:phosphoribosylformylglycinamidine synthase